MFPVMRACLACALALAPAYAAAQPVAAPRIPHVQGLTVTTAIAERGGDYESRKRIAGREGDAWLVAYSASVAGDDGRPRSLSSERLVHDADLSAARSYRTAFEEDVREDYPGTTALGVSSTVLNELKTTGESRVSLLGESRWVAQALAGETNAALPGAGVFVANAIGALTRNGNLPFKGELQRRGNDQFSVLVNGRTQSLPMLTASGRLTARNGQTMQAELGFLDDPANPIALQWRIGSASLRVVRIDFPQPKAELALAEVLRKQRRVVLPGLYFDFGSPRLRPESAAALAVIAAAIRSAPPGTLRIEGHTDAIGSDAANLTLSKARAASVRAALMKVDASFGKRLLAEGFGETRPQADNRTLEGRARNRRVELVLP